MSVMEVVLLVLVMFGVGEGNLDRGRECHPQPGNKFVFRVNFHTGGLLGEFQVDGCQGISPTLQLRRGETYTFIQDDITNWMHPLGLAYYPDGAHGFLQFDEVPELEAPTPDSCSEAAFLCNPGPEVRQAPDYAIDGEFTSFEDGGLDIYEPAFQVPQDQWMEHKYAVNFTVPLESKTKTLFYFCHIHSGMSGEIKITNPAENSNPLIQKFDPMEYYKEQEEFDKECGTSQVSPYHTEKEKFCPNMKFLCETDDNPQFSRCMEAIDCKMNYEMRVEEHRNPMVVFMHQMIPHHENAVNMARIALKHAETAEGFDDEDLDVPALLRDIVNTQNKQIQDMESWLKRYGQETPKYCPTPETKTTCDSGSGTLMENLLLVVVGAVGVLL